MLGWGWPRVVPKVRSSFSSPFSGWVWWKAKSASLWLGSGRMSPLSSQLPLFLLSFSWAWLSSPRMLLPTQGQRPWVMTGDVWEGATSYTLKVNLPEASEMRPWPREGTDLCGSHSEQWVTEPGQPQDHRLLPPAALASQVIPPLCLLSICVVKGFLGAACRNQWKRKCESS